MKKPCLTSSVPNGKIDALLQHDVQLVHPGANEGRRICITRLYCVDVLWVEGGVESMSPTWKLKLQPQPVCTHFFFLLSESPLTLNPTLNLDNNLGKKHTIIKKKVSNFMIIFLLI